MKHLLTFIVAILAMMLTSCASQRALTDDVQGISARIDADVKAFNMDQSCGGTLKMKRGEAIQLSLTKFGIEGVRVIFTPEEILFINKLSKTYLRTSYKEADKLLGSDGLVNFRSIEAYFWNENGGSNNYTVIPVAGFVPLEIKTTFSHKLRAGQYSLPRQYDIEMSGADGAIETGKAKLKLTKIQAANNWQPNTEVPEKYKNLNFIALIKKLLNK